MNTPSTAVSPGLGGFLAFFVLAIALWLLMRNMNARMRRMSYRAQQEDEARRKGDETQAGLHSEQDAPREMDAGEGDAGPADSGTGTEPDADAGGADADGRPGDRPA